MKTGALVTILVILSLIVGGFAGSYMFPQKVTETKEVIVEKNVTQVVEVVKNITVDSNAALIESAKQEYLNEISDNRTLRTVDGVKYDFEQVSIKKLNDVSVSVDTSNKKDTVTTVSFTAELKFLDSDTEDKAYRDDVVVVKFHSKDNVDTELSID